MAVPINSPAIKLLAVVTEGSERRTQHQGTLPDFFAASPLRESGLKIERPQDGLCELSAIALTELDAETLIRENKP